MSSNMDLMSLQKIRNYCTALLGIVLVGCVDGGSKPSQDKQKGPTVSARQMELVQETLQTFPEGTEFSLGFLYEGETHYFGARLVDGHSEEVANSNHLFEIGSITKVFTSTLLTSLVLEGQVRLEDPVQKHIGFTLGTAQEITLEQLANHTSGLPRMPSNLDLFEDPDNPYKAYDDQKMKAYLVNDLKLNHPPGTEYEYSNLGAGLLGFLVAKLSGSPYEEFVRDKVFSEYEMLHSTTDRTKIRGKLVPGLDPDGREVSNWDFDALTGAGAIFSSVVDLAKFGNAQFDSTDTKLVMTQRPTFIPNDEFKVGLGWHILNQENGKELLWHNGGTGGYSSSMALDVQNKQGIIVLSNVSAFHPFRRNVDELCLSLMETFKK
ncbi:hypothetical protein FGF1_16430 [Flavobacteriaceae bacterium GF1]